MSIFPSDQFFRLIFQYWTKWVFVLTLNTEVIDIYHFHCPRHKPKCGQCRWMWLMWDVTAGCNGIPDRTISSLGHQLLQWHRTDRGGSFEKSLQVVMESVTRQSCYHDNRCLGTWNSIQEKCWKLHYLGKDTIILILNKWTLYCNARLAVDVHNDRHICI